MSFHIWLTFKLLMELIYERFRQLVAPSREALASAPTPFKYSEAFFGLGGFRRFAQAIDLPANPLFLTDNDARIKEFHDRVAASGHVAEAADVSIKCIKEVTLDDVRGSHWLIGGGPCPPWSDNGSRLGMQDPRAEFSMKFIDLVIDAALDGHLLGFAFENSKNIFYLQDGDDMSFDEWAFKRMDKKIPFFKVGGLVYRLIDIMPKSRDRGWIRGLRLDILMRGSCISNLPQPIKDLQMQRPCVEQFLDPDIPNIKLSQITAAGRAKNLKDYISEIKADMIDGKAGKLAIFEIDRAFDKVYRKTLKYDQIPTLRTHGPDYFMISCDDVTPSDLDNDDVEKRVCRYLQESDRYKLQGHEAFLAQSSSQRLAFHLTGNAYATPMVGAVALPMIEAIAKSNVLESPYLSPVQLEALVSRKRAYTEALQDPPDLVVSRKRPAHAT